MTDSSDSLEYPAAELSAGPERFEANPEPLCPVDPQPRRRPRPQHLVIYDGECGFCKRSVHWLFRHDRYGALRAEPNQTADLSPELRAACQDALHVITAEGKVFKAGRAILFCGRFTRWSRLARLMENPPLIWAVELGYVWVANHRYLVSKWLLVDEPMA